MNITRYTLLLFVILVVSCTSGNRKSENTEVEEKRDSIVMQKFASEEYGFSVHSPADWKHEVFEKENNQTVISIYPAGKIDSAEFPLKIHGNASLTYLSVFPGGYGTELPSGENRNILKGGEKPVRFEINRNESLTFFLENGQEWGYFIVPASPPAGWSQHGFIFAQAAVDNFEIKCFDRESGEELEKSECDPLTGDSVVRYGEVDEEDLEHIKRILSSFEFEDINKGQQADNGGADKGITVTKPQPGSEITSPLQITGKARGSWFFESVIEIELRKNGITLASTSGKARGNWMTNDFVDFSATLTFSEVKETGQSELLFRSSNPSGKKELEKTFKVPVVIDK